MKNTRKIRRQQVKDEIAEVSPWNLSGSPEDICKELSPESYMKQSYGPYQKPDFNKLLEKSKRLSFTDGMIAGEEHLARKILRILYER